MRPRRATLLVAVAGLALVVAAAAYAAVALSRRIPPVTVVTARLPRAFPRRPTGLAWPAQGQAAVAVRGVGLIRSNNSAQPQPIASVAKVMTALIVLRDHPLATGQNGTAIAVTKQDVAMYKADLKSGQSTAPVAVGEVLTERQMLEGLLLPSGNNLATLLAQWDAGSVDAFVAKMNAEAGALRMAHTHYADPAGISPLTVSTALDQLRLVSRALRVRTIAQILGLRQVQLPVGGILRNSDALLGTHGVVWGKTGSTSAAGGCLVFAARIGAAGRTLNVVGVLLGQPYTLEDPLTAVFRATTALLASARRQVIPLRAVLRGRAFGKLRSAWEAPVNIRLGHVPSLVGWSGLPLRMRIAAPRHLHAPVGAGQVVGVLVVRAGPQRTRIKLVAERAVAKPSLGWRLTHP